MSARKMKDSGNQWIGEIPEEWETRKIKFIANISTGNTPSKNNEEYYADEGLKWVKPDNLADFNEIQITEEYLSDEGQKVARIAPANSVLVCCIGTIGKIGYSSESVAYNQQINAVSFGEKMKWKYGMYFLSSQQEQARFYMNGNVMFILNTENQKRIEITLPDLKEQQKIVSYLDEKCEAIDKIVARKQKQNEQLAEYRQSLITEAVTKGLNPSVPMKNSGIEWIGEIPEEWQVLPLKYLLKYPLQYGATETGEDYVDGYPRYIRITDIDSNNKLKEENQRYLNFKDASPFILNDGDILFARSGATVGKTFLYLSEYGKAAFAGYLVRASVNTDVAFSKFIYYYTFSYCYEYWKNMIFSQATIQNIGADKYSVIDVPLPPLAEQKAIAAYLDKKCDEIDALSKRNKNIIESLQEYKQSLIYEAVTGKIEL